MKEKFKLSSFMIDKLLNDYYVGIEYKYLGYEYFINEDNEVSFCISFMTYYHGKETLLMTRLSKGGFARVIGDALTKINGFLNPYVKITAREGAVGFEVDYDIKETFIRRRNKKVRYWK